MLLPVLKFSHWFREEIIVVKQSIFGTSLQVYHGCEGKSEETSFVATVPDFFHLNFIR